MSEENNKHICPNCDKEFDNNFDYCPHCGQKNSEQRIGLRNFISDYLSANFNFDSKILITLKLLLFKPAFLTKEFFRGRQTKYIPPIRLYLFISLAYFFVFSLSLPPTSNLINDDSPSLIDSLAITIDEDTLDIDSNNFNIKIDSLSTEEQDTSLTYIESFFDKKADLLDSDTGLYQLFENVKKYIPTGMFILLPFLALIFSILFYKQKFYIENLIFVLHLQSAIFIIGTLFKLIDFVYDSNWLIMLEIIVLIVLSFFWIKRYYEVKIWTAIWKQTLFYIAYFFLFIIYLILIFIFSLANL